MSISVIVGGGLSGLVAASFLKNQSIPFVGLEAGEVLGGRILTGHHRLFIESSLRFIDELVPGTEWETIEEAAAEWRKGQWAKPSDDLEAMERFYLSPRFYSPLGGFEKVVSALKEQVHSHYRFHKAVTKVRAEDAKVICSDGEEIAYDQLLWCAPLELLLKGYEGPALRGLKLPKRETENGGVSLDQELKAAPFPQHNTVVLPFRYKDKKMRALGIREGGKAEASGSVRVHWILFLENAILENREEVAKCVRALKRELGKAFPTLCEPPIQERLVFLPSISGDAVAEAKSLRLSEKITYLGPQLRLTETSDEPQNLDLIFENCRKLPSLFSELPQ